MSFVGFENSTIKVCPTYGFIRTNRLYYRTYSTYLLRNKSVYKYYVLLTYLLMGEKLLAATIYHTANQSTITAAIQY